MAWKRAKLPENYNYAEGGYIQTRIEVVTQLHYSYMSLSGSGFPI